MQVEQLLQSLQFQDRVHQILDQLRGSLRAAVATLGEAAAQGRVPDAADWQVLLSTGYTTREQRAVAGATGAARTETEFF